MAATPVPAPKRRRCSFKWLLFLAASTAAPAAAAETEDCELHIWPASGTGANNGGLLSNFGMVGALADYEQHKDANLRDQVALIEGLTPVKQARVLAAAGVPELLGMAGAQIVFQNDPLAERSIGKMKARRSNSSAPCYAELIVGRNFYQKSALHGRTLATQFTFKDFRTGRSEARVVTARARNPVAGFPPQRPEDAEAAERGLAEAFAANLREFANKVRRR